MTVRQLAKVLNELPASFSDSEIEFGSQLTERDGKMIWLDQAIAAIYANPDRADVTLCAGDVGKYIQQNKKLREHLRLIPVYDQ